MDLFILYPASFCHVINLRIKTVFVLLKNETCIGGDAASERSVG